jgi:hypothetical protein
MGGGMHRGHSRVRSLRQLPLAAYVPVVVAAAGVWIVVSQWANARPLWLDEQMIALNFRDRSFAGLAGRLWLDQSAPLGWLFLQRLVLLTLGASEVALRAVPTAYGVATILAAFYVGWRWLSPAGTTALVMLCSFGQWMTFHAVELKPYSADTFWGLTLPALSVSVGCATSGEARRRAVVMWLVAAALAHWFSLGALLVLPACCVVVALTLRRHPETFKLLATGAAVLIASVAAHYLLSIRHAQASESLQEFWQFAFPERTAGVTERLRWMAGQLHPFALKPGGTTWTVAFWVLACIGFVAASTRMLGLVAGLVVVSGFLLGALRLMPLYERLSLWAVPAAYLGIALAVDRAVRVFRSRPFEHPVRVGSGVAIAATAVLLCANVVERGVVDLRDGRPPDTNHGTDDRSAMKWLLRQRQPGDLLVTTHHAQPAIWWYGGLSLAATDGRSFPDGSPILVAEYHESRHPCRGREPEKRLDGRSRIQLYLSFVDMPEHADDVLLDRLSKFGTISAVSQFAGQSRVAILDPAIPGPSGRFWADGGKEHMLKGCIVLGQGRIW